MVSSQVTNTIRTEEEDVLFVRPGLTHLQRRNTAVIALSKLPNCSNNDHNAPNEVRLLCEKSRSNDVLHSIKNQSLDSSAYHSLLQGCIKRGAFSNSSKS
jgi:hypothetical protein